MQYINTPVSRNLLYLHDSHKTQEDQGSSRRLESMDSSIQTRYHLLLFLNSLLMDSLPKILLQPLISTFFLQIPCAAMRMTTSLCLRVASSCRAWSGPPGTSEAKGEEIRWCLWLWVAAAALSHTKPRRIKVQMGKRCHTKM